MSASHRSIPVVHVLDAHTTAGNGLWGKERVVRSLMLAQRASGVVSPRLAVFTACRLADEMRDLGFSVSVLETVHRRLPVRSLATLVRELGAGPPVVLHTHGFKANVVGRLARLRGVRLRALVATAHGWPDENRTTKAYNELDRRSAFLSDVTTVTAEPMLQRFPKAARTLFVANGIADRPVASVAERAAARAAFDLPADRIVFGFVGRATAAKGLREFLSAARAALTEPYLWAIAGTGDLEGAIAEANLANVRFYGHLAETDRFFDAIDIFVQASHSEGLSLALLEAMRAGKAIVATDVGSTSFAVRDGTEGSIVAAADATALAMATRALGCDPARARRFGESARERYERTFRSELQHEAFLRLYRAYDRA